MSVAAPPTTTTSSGYLFSDGFESGNFSAWSATYTGSGTYPPIVQSPIKHSGTYAYEQHYFICGDSTNTGCGAAHQDLNRSVAKALSPGQTHFFLRGYVYFKTPESDATPGAIIQRKLIRISDSPSPSTVNVTGTTYGFMLNSWNASSGVLTPTVNLSLAVGATVVSGCSAGVGPIGTGSTTPNIGNIYQFNYDTWYSLELEVQLNTPGSFDGIGRIWVNGVQVLSRTDLNFRDSCTTPVTYIGIGNQADRQNYNAVDEYRYWDDVVISQSYIGP
jgi:hypothetical protein